MSSLKINALRILGATLAVVVVAIPLAHAQNVTDSYNSHCWWEQGAYACASRLETERTITTTLCGASLTSACTSKTVEKFIRKPSPGGKMITLGK
jgi:hypothetical protein